MASTVVNELAFTENRTLFNVCLSESTSTLFNVCLSEGTYPYLLKIAEVVPIFKKENATKLLIIVQYHFFYNLIRYLKNYCIFAFIHI